MITTDLAFLLAEADRSPHGVGVVGRLLAAHAGDGRGCCRTCSGPTRQVRWPCALHVTAALAENIVVIAPRARQID